MTSKRLSSSGRWQKGILRLISLHAGFEFRRHTSNVQPSMATTHWKIITDVVADDPNLLKDAIVDKVTAAAALLLET